MKKVFALILTVLSMIALLTGCVHEDIGIVLNADGTGQVAATVGIDKDTYNQLIGMGVDLFEGEAGEPFEYEYKGKTYIALTETKEYASYEELRQALLELTYDTDELADLEDIEEWETDEKEQEHEEAAPEEESAQHTHEEEDAEETAAVDNHIFKEVVIEEKKGLFSKSLKFSATLNALPDDENEENSMAASFHITVSVATPYGIKKAGDTAVVEGNKATFEIEDLSVENTLSVEAKETNTEMIIGIVVLLAVVLVILILLPKLTGTKEKK